MTDRLSEIRTRLTYVNDTPGAWEAYRVEVLEDLAWCLTRIRQREDELAGEIKAGLAALRERDELRESKAAWEMTANGMALERDNANRALAIAVKALEKLACEGGPHTFGGWDQCCDARIALNEMAEK